MSLPLLLFWTDPWTDVPQMQREASAYCRLSQDRADMADADAVIFPLPTAQGSIPAQKGHPDQLWVLWSQESAVHYPALVDPAVTACFDLTATYRLDSDVPIPYVRWNEFTDLPPAVAVAERRATPVSAWISSRSDRCGRDDHLRELMRHIDVDSYGKVAHNADLVDDRGSATKLATIADYRFTIAFENSIAEDYVTEKFFQPLRVGSVPIYRGAPNIAEFAPAPDCYIDANRFDSPAALAAFLTAMTDDDYAALHAWRTAGPQKEFLQRFRRFDGPTIRRLVTAVVTIRTGRRLAGAT